MCRVHLIRIGGGTCVPGAVVGLPDERFRLV